MSMSNDSREENSRDRHEGMDLPSDVWAAGITGDEVLSSCEKSMGAREDVAHAREETANQRDSVAQVREQALHMRETHVSSCETNGSSSEIDASSLEKIVQESDALRAALEHHITRLREANEHLVITAVQAQAMRRMRLRNRICILVPRSASASIRKMARMPKR